MCPAIGWLNWTNQFDWIDPVDRSRACPYNWKSIEFAFIKNFYERLHSASGCSSFETFYWLPPIGSHRILLNEESSSEAPHWILLVDSFVGSIGGPPMVTLLWNFSNDMTLSSSKSLRVAANVDRQLNFLSIFHKQFEFLISGSFDCFESKR